MIQVKTSLNLLLKAMKTLAIIFVKNKKEGIPYENWENREDVELTTFLTMLDRCLEQKSAYFQSIKRMHYSKTMYIIKLIKENVF